jgi:hypothetical protein
MLENSLMQGNKSVLFVLGAFALVALVPACSPKKSAAPAQAAASTQPTLVAKVVYFEGEVRIDGAAPELGKELPSKVTIETGPSGSCDIVLGAKNAIRISPSAIAQLDFSGIVKEVSLKKGGFAAVLRGLAKSEGSDTFRVVTAAAAAAVRGTCFCVWADEGETYVCACNGAVRTIDAKGSNVLSLESSHHLAKYYSVSGGVTSVRPAGLEHHDDAAVESLAARIGETVDWTKEDR